MTIPAFLRSPLLHFFLLGGLVFGVYSLKNPPMDDGPGEDVIRLTDAEASDSPVRTLKATARHYSPGDTDLSWTRLTPWRALLAAALEQATGTVHRGSVEAGSGNPAARLLTAWLQSRLRVPITERRSEG